ncbi:hypothetical protein D3C85_735440 [compost metagenome]
MNDRAELVGGLVILEQRRTGKGDKGGVGQRLLHANMVLAPLTAMTLIDQHDKVRALVDAFRQLGGSVELLNKREDDALAALADLLCQPLARGGHGRLFVFLASEFAAGGEGLAELALQIHPVGHHQDAALFQALVQDQRLAQKHHGERLARTGGVPDHPTFSPAIGAFLVDTLDQPLDAKHLLVAGDDLARLLVKQGEQASHFQQPVG